MRWAVALLLAVLAPCPALAQDAAAVRAMLSGVENCCSAWLSSERRVCVGRSAAILLSMDNSRAGVPALVLDRLQDPGNVGSLLRTAAALGFGQVLSLRGTVALWSPKVLRAGMGAHTGLSLCEGLEPTALDGLALPLVATSSHSAAPLHTADLPWPLAWVLGHEGQGVSPAVAQRCGLTVSIPQPGGQESLNVAAAGAICLYESVRRRLSTAGAATA